MLKLLASIILFISMIFFGKANAQEEKAPKKVFEYMIQISHLKNQEQAISALNELKNYNKIERPNIEFLEYKLYFKCTNHNLQEYPVLEQIKAILSKNGIEIDRVERKLIRQ